MQRFLSTSILVVTTGVGLGTLIVFSFLLVADLQQAFRLSRESFATISAFGLFITSLQLAWKLWNVLSARPTFAAAIAGGVPRAFRLKITNTSKTPTEVTARCVATYGGVTTEAISLLWEESTSERMLLNPDDHGTLQIGTFLVQETDPPTQGILIHAVNFLSSRFGQRLPQFSFGHHLSNEGPMEMPITVTVFPDKPAKGSRSWDFVIRENPYNPWRADMEAAPKVARLQTVSKLRSILRKVGLRW